MNIRTEFLAEDADPAAMIVRKAVLAVRDPNYTPEALLAWSRALGPFDVLERATRPESAAVLVEEAGALVGFGVRCGADIDLVYVHPDHGGKGIGSEIMRQLIASGEAAGYDPLTLRSSHNAKPLYEKFGFQSTGCATSKLEGSDVPCLMMERRALLV